MKRNWKLYWEWKHLKSANEFFLLWKQVDKARKNIENKSGIYESVNFEWSRKNVGDDFFKEPLDFF